MNLACFAIFKKEKNKSEMSEHLLEEVNPMGRKWANIVAKKTAKDGANSKVYAKFGVEIYVAAKQGEPDPESNSALKFVLERAKQAQVPLIKPKVTQMKLSLRGVMKDLGLMVL